MKNKIGIFEEKVDFADKAYALVHPFDAKSSADDILLKTIHALLTLGPQEIHQRRQKSMAHLCKQS